MDAVQTGKPPESQTHVTFETAAEHATARVPVAGPFQRVGDVRDHLIGQRYESASHIVVCEADTSLGIVTIEKLLLAPADAKMESLMDREPRLSPLASIRKLPRGTRFAMEHPLWLSLTDMAISWG